MKGHWKPPGRLTETPDAHLSAFGIGTIPGARINTTDPAVSQAQRRFMGVAEHHPEQLRGKMPDMTKAQMHDFAATSEKGLPKRKH